MKLSVRVNIDRKAALLRGLVLEDEVIIPVGPEDLSAEDWALLVNSLQRDHVKKDDYLERSKFSVNGPEPADLVSALANYRAGLETERLAKEAKLAERALAFAEYKAEAASVLETNRVIAQSDLIPATRRIWALGLNLKEGDELWPYRDCDAAGFDQLQLKSLPWWQHNYNRTAEEENDIRAFEQGQYEIKAQADERVRQANLEAIAKARPELDRQLAEKVQAEAQAEADRKAANAARFAKRLETGIWERETDSYNERRYGAPWVAKVTFPNGPKAVYEFSGESTGKWGKAGILSIECKPGEIIAWGQKDLRGNSHEHHVLYMRANGSMEELDKVEAYKRSRQP